MSVIHAMTSVMDYKDLEVVCILKYFTTRINLVTCMHGKLMKLFSHADDSYETRKSREHQYCNCINFRILYQREQGKDPVSDASSFLGYSDY